VHYHPPKPLYVKWNRLFNSLLVISAVFFQRIELLYLFLALNIVTFVVTIHYGPARLLLWPLRKLFGLRFLDVPEAYVRSYRMTASTERFEILLRILAVTVAVTLYGCCPTATWLMASAMGIFMLISAFFGFCLSALGFIAVRSLKARCRVCG